MDDVVSSAPIRDGTSRSSSSSRAACPTRTFRIVASADNARTLGPTPPNVTARDSTCRSASVRECLLRREGRRAPRARELVLGCDDDAAPGDGVREARRGDAHRGDRSRLPPRGRRQLPSRRSRRSRRARAGRHGRARRSARSRPASGLQGRETVERHLTWARYANEMRQLLVDAADGATASA